MMNSSLPSQVCLGDEVALALQAGQPVVALESAVITHGLPEPQNLEAASCMAEAVRARGAIPAICLVHESLLWIGADLDRAAAVARNPKREKASVRDLGIAIATGAAAGLTVSATLFAAALARIQVFATGGIGGVHAPVGSGDVSADLLQLSRSPVVTVCSGAKSVLDIPRTLEFLETAGVPVFSYRTRDFPGFYLLKSGAYAPVLSSPDEVARAARMQWELGLTTGLVLGNPIPAHEQIAEDDWRDWLQEAQSSAEREHIQGKAVTPYLLDRVASLSGGRTVQANIALLESNAILAAEVAVALST
jgi:pseudouridylate synthase